MDPSFIVRKCFATDGFPRKRAMAMWKIVASDAGSIMTIKWPSPNMVGENMPRLFLFALSLCWLFSTNPLLAKEKVVQTNPRTIIELSDGWRFQFGQADASVTTATFDDQHMGTGLRSAHMEPHRRI